MPSDPPPQASSRSRSAIFVALFFLAALALLVARAMPREASRDEEQFVAAGALLLRHGLLPYVDYPYFHLPNLAYVYAALFSVTDHLLVAARLFNVLCGWLTLGVVFAVAAREFRVAGTARLWIAGFAPVALLASPLFGLTSGLAWNHDLAVLTAVAGFAALLRAVEGATQFRWIGVAAFLLGVAIGTRLSFLPLVLPFMCIAAFTASHLRERLMRAAVFSCILVVASAPALLLAARAPEEFLFYNFVYNGPLNRAYRVASGNSGVQLSSKLLFIVSLMKFPHNAALLVAFLYLAIWLPARDGWRAFIAQRKAFAVIACFPFLAIGAFAPSPSYKQYYYAFVPFLVFGCVFGLAGFWRDHRTRGPRLVGGALAAISAAALLIDLPRLRHLASPDEWPPVRIHELGRELRAHTAGPVLTLAPILPLEGGIDIYEEFATGLFAWRTAAFLPDAAKPKFSMVDAETLDEFLLSNPPPAILTRRRGPAHHQRPLSAYAQSHGYRRILMRDDVDLWMRGP